MGARAMRLALLLVFVLIVSLVIDNLLDIFFGTSVHESLKFLIEIDLSHLPEIVRKLIRLPIVSIISLLVAVLIMLLAEYISGKLLEYPTRKALAVIKESVRIKEEAEAEMDKAKSMMKKAEKMMRKTRTKGDSDGTS